LSRIAKVFGVTVSDLVSWNGISNPSTCCATASICWA
jgi:hypothetical protein